MSNSDSILKITLINGRNIFCEIKPNKTIRQATIIKDGFMDVIGIDGNIYISFNVNQILQIELQSRKN